MHIILMIVGAAVVYEILRRYYIKNWDRKLRIMIKFSTNDAVCGDTFELTETVSNIKRLPLPFIHLKFQADSSLVFKDGTENAKISDAVYRDDVFSLLMNQRITRRIPVTCAKRGVYGIRDAEIVFTGLFMNDICIRKIESAASVTIYPDPYYWDDAEVLYSKVSGIAERSSLINPDPFAFRQIREYDATDPMNTINWKASARTGELMVNQYNETTAQEVCILLNLEPEGMLVYERLSEASISAAAGIAETLLAKGISVSLVTNGRDYESKEPAVIYPGSECEHIKDIDTALARIRLEEGQEDFAEFIAKMTDGYGRKIFEESRSGILYVIISQNARKELQLEMNNLIEHDSQAVYIVPHFKDNEADLRYFAGSSVMWEVPHNAKG